MLMAARDGYWFLYDALTMKRIRRLAGPAGDAEPQWHPTNPNLLYFLNRNGIGMQIHVLDVRTNQRKLASDIGHTSERSGLAPRQPGPAPKALPLRMAGTGASRLKPGTGTPSASSHGT